MGSRRKSPASRSRRRLLKSGALRRTPPRPRAGPQSPTRSSFRQSNPDLSPGYPSIETVCRSAPLLFFAPLENSASSNASKLRTNADERPELRGRSRFFHHDEPGMTVEFEDLGPEPWVMDRPDGFVRSFRYRVTHWDKPFMSLSRHHRLLFADYFRYMRQNGTPPVIQPWKLDVGGGNLDDRGEKKI